jgi:predicted nuclease with RNAse H fold
MVYRGIELRKRLEGRGYQVIEVYPYASKVRLWGKPVPSKLRSGGLALSRTRLANLLPTLAPYTADFNHDLCDAALAAYTAYLYHQNATEQIGSLEEGAIYIPETPSE